MSNYAIPEADLYPRDEAHRYRVYARTGDGLRVLACAGSPEALGVAIVQLDEDEKEQGLRLSDLGAVGVLDAIDGRWIILPWHRNAPAGRPPENDDLADDEPTAGGGSELHGFTGGEVPGDGEETDE